MKSKITKFALVAILALFCQQSAKAFTFCNSTSCVVVVTWEVRDFSCGVCATGSLTLNPSDCPDIVLCSGSFMDICINLVSVGGSAPTPANMHYHNSSCHLSASTGSGSGGGCSWSAALSGTTGWSIW